MNNYKIKNACTLSGAKTKFNANMKALSVLDAAKNGASLTPSDKDALNDFTGWGGIPAAFELTNGKWSKEASELMDTLTDAEYQAASRSVLDSFYTPEFIIDAIYSGLHRMGFRSGRIIDPAMGTGRFFGRLPEAIQRDSDLVGVELDPIPGAIAKNLYPDSTLHIETNFSDVDYADGYFDVAVGNVPFGSHKLYDRKVARKSLSIHNFFFLKSLNLLRTGGILAMVVSNFMLDKKNNDVRKMLAGKANLVGAIRLPNNVFSDAGTQVTTDILFFQKVDKPENNPSWLNVCTQADSDGLEITYNRYFDEHPEFVLGEMACKGTMYGSLSGACVDDGRDLNDSLNEVINLLPENIYTVAANTSKSAVEIEPVVDLEALTDLHPEQIKIYNYFVTKDNRIAQRVFDANEVPQATITKVGVKRGQRIHGLIALRDILLTLLEMESSAYTSDVQLDAQRQRLNNVYADFTKRHGAIHSFGNTQAFKNDPDLPLLLSLETDYENGISKVVAKRLQCAPVAPSWTLADIFTQRVITPYQRPTHADTAHDALMISLSDKGYVDIDFMASLTGLNERDILNDLNKVVFFDPQLNNYVTADEYLSGNVVEKLDVAKDKALECTAGINYQSNIMALEAVQPAPIEAVDIYVKIGAPWVPPTDIAAFVSYLINADATINYNASTDHWSCNIPSDASNIKNTATYGTERMPAAKIIKCLLNNRPITVKDKVIVDGQNRYITNTEETLSANNKAQEIRDEFEDWLWSDDERRIRLTDYYNKTYNVFNVRHWDGSHLVLPGKNPHITLRPNQINGVWRAIQNQNVLFDHEVGTGKTFTCVTSIMEMRRMKLVNKPVIVVPNHIVLDWSRDFMTLYPQAKILVPTKRDFEKKNRQILFSRMATGDWDAIIVPHSSFERIPMPIDFQIRFLKDQVSDIKEAIHELSEREGRKLSTKRLEKKIEGIKHKIDKLTLAKEKVSSLDFSQIGIDMLVVDESDEYKNLYYNTGMSNVGGLGNPEGSQKAFDMFMKTRFTQTNDGRVLFATGTPISNTIAELYTLQRYMQYDVLKERNLVHFDQWARVFAEPVAAWELDATGVNYELKTRLARFVNVSELVSMTSQYSDCVTQDDFKQQVKDAGLAWPIPPIATGKPESIIVKPTTEQLEYMQNIVKRAENKPSDPSIDNMLKITNDARKCGLHMRTIDPRLPESSSEKINTCVDNVYSIWEQWSEHKGTQLIFSDLSTPKSAQQQLRNEILSLVSRANDGDEAAEQELAKIPNGEILSLNNEYSAYDDIKAQLVERGVPVEQIAFIHDAKNDKQRISLFEDMRHGRVRILIGSTRKMGAGTNVQRLLVASHNLDGIWRPRDAVQRDGRIVRPGNYLFETIPNFSIRILRYATERTYDARMWQTVEVKQRFITQIRKATPGLRVVEDVCGTTASFAELKAAATGNLLILEQVRLDSEVNQLKTLQKHYKRKLLRVRDTIRALDGFEEKRLARIATMENDIIIRDENTQDDFSITISNKHYNEHGSAAFKLTQIMNTYTNINYSAQELVGHYRGFNIEFKTTFTGASVYLSCTEHRYHVSNLSYSDKGNGLIRKINNTIDNIEAFIVTEQNYLGEDRENLKNAIAESTTTFKQEKELALKEKQLANVLLELELCKDKDYTPRSVNDVLGINQSESNVTPKQLSFFDEEEAA